MIGNLMAISYFLLFQVIGICMASAVMKEENKIVQMLLGSTFGSLLLQWLPILFAFFSDFSLISHILALVCALGIGGILIVKSNGSKLKNKIGETVENIVATFKKHSIIVVFAMLTMILWCCLLYTHTLRPAEDGSMHCGQCTYGDMNMHLGFITSVARQETFPPEYSLYPGFRLAYPFLSDSISSSLLVVGGSLRLAYILPMLFAFMQIMGMLYALAYRILKSRAKACIAWLMYLLNGGLGIIYFIGPSPKVTFEELLHGFYLTPTNLIDENIRWVNIIADMFLPQRATLFGYAIAFPCIYLLYTAVFEKRENRKTYFISAGILFGLLPMIHTHSFMGVGLIAASWLLYQLVMKLEFGKKIHPYMVGIAFFAIMLVLERIYPKEMREKQSLMYLAIAGIGLLVCLGIVLLIKEWKENQLKDFFSTWGLFLICGFVLALPQLLFWTFGQVSEGGFVRGYFNWGNISDEYFIFYLKNLGVVFILVLLAMLLKNKDYGKLLLPVGVIWFLAELIVFTPNTYDNNKLLYIAYLFMVIVAADYIVEIAVKCKFVPIRGVLVTLLLGSCFISGVLSLVREVVSDYEIYGAPQVALAEFVEEYTLPEEVFLTDTRHTNEIASLTGRNIVCGSDVFLYFHGIDTTERKEHLRQMFESPASSAELFELYNVEYVVLTPYEYSSYMVDESWFSENMDLLFEYDSVKLYEFR